VADTITVTYKVNEDGSLTKIAAGAEKAAKATDKAGTAADKYQKKQKGVGQAGLSSAKSFSKMTTGITGGLVPAYATLAANVFALTAAFNFFKRAADVQILEKSQIRYATSTGLGLQSITQGLRDASNGMLGFREAAEAAAIGVAKGFSPAQLENLAAGAQRAAAALGRGFEDAFDRLIRGASKAEPELLDELGITLRLKTATESYAKSLGVQADALTATQRSQAVLLETQRQLDELFGTGPAETNPFIVLAKTFEDLTRSGTDAVMPMINGLVGIINKSGMAALAVFGALGLSILKTMMPTNMLGDAIDGAMAKSQRATEEAIGEQMAYAIEVENSQKALDALAQSQSQKTAGAAMNAGAGKSKLVTKLSKGEDLTPMQKGRVKKMLKEAERQYKDHGEIVRGTFKGMDIAIVTDMKKSFLDMDKSKVGFFKRMKQSFKKGRLTAKTVFAQIKKGGTKAFQGLGKAAKFAGDKIGKMMKFAGFIGILVMVYQAMVKIMESPFTIISNFLGAFDTAANFILDTFKTPLVAIAKYIDIVRDVWRGLLNGLIDGVNSVASFFGKTDKVFENIKDDGGSAADAMLELAEAGVDTKKVFQTSSFGADMLDIETEADQANTQVSNLSATLEMFKKMGEDVNATVKGLTSSLTEVTDAERGVIVATSMGSISLSDRIKKIKETSKGLDAMGNEMEFSTLTVAQQEEAMRALHREMANLKQLSPQMAAAFNDPDLEAGMKKMEFIELHSRNATTEMKAFRDGIEGVTSAIGDGNLASAEYLLDTLKKSAQSAAESYRKLGDDASLAAANAADAEYASALGENIGDTDTYHASLKTLREETERHNVAVQQANLLSGERGAVRALELAAITTGLQIKTIDKQIEAELNDELRDQLELKRELLGLKQREQEIAVIDKTQGTGMGAAARLGDNMQSEDFTKAMAGDSNAAKIGAMGDALSPMTAELAKLGPDGEAMAAALSGATVLAETFMGAFEQMKGGTMTLADGLGMAAGAVQALGAMQAAKSKAAIAGVDKEIAAEKARDGKSSGSLAKIAAMEKKKEQLKRKAFEQDKKMKMASTVIATATGMMNAFAHADPITGAIMAAMVGAMGAAQLSIISGMTYQGGAASAPAAPTKLEMGSRSNSVDLGKGNNAGGELAYMRGESGIGTGATNFKPTSAFSGYKNRSAGGYIVGEQGPEIFMPETPGEIIPAGRSMGGAPANVNFNISAVDATGVEDVLIRQKGHIIRMIREAANEHGDTFLESVRDEAY
tara:strand:- start:233 stop:4009 length:3777 start_codon:yes stop_codon:yes gene_type:complete